MKPLLLRHTSHIHTFIEQGLAGQTSKSSEPRTVHTKGCCKSAHLHAGHTLEALATGTAALAAAQERQILLQWQLDADVTCWHTARIAHALHIAMSCCSGSCTPGTCDTCMHCKCTMPWQRLLQWQQHKRAQLRPTMHALTIHQASYPTTQKTILQVSQCICNICVHSSMYENKHHSSYQRSNRVMRQHASHM
jgi:hypothetical protein